MLVSTHLVEDVAAACTDVVLIDAGRLVVQGVPGDLAAAAGDDTGAGDSAAERGYSAILRRHRETEAPDPAHRAAPVAIGPAPGRPAARAAPESAS